MSDSAARLRAPAMRRYALPSAACVVHACTIDRLYSVASHVLRTPISARPYDLIPRGSVWLSVGAAKFAAVDGVAQLLARCKVSRRVEVHLFALEIRLVRLAQATASPLHGLVGLAQCQPPQAACSSLTDPPSSLLLRIGIASAMTVRFCLKTHWAASSERLVSGLAGATGSHHP